MKVRFDEIESINNAKNYVANKLKSKNIQYFLFVNIYLYWLLWTLILIKLFNLI